MHKIYHKLFVVLTVFILLGGVYLYFLNSLKSEASLISSLQSSLSTNLFSGDDKISSDISFIGTLASLNNIQIDTTLFSSPNFISLKDNTVNLEKGVIPGRINPFAPAKINSKANSDFSLIKTNNPAEIKDTSAVLSGSINSTDKTISGYFEYGLTKDLGQNVSQNTMSLLGVFVTNVTSLKSKTTYFYKACTKINNSVSCGNTVSFETK